MPGNHGFAENDREHKEPEDNSARESMALEGGNGEGSVAHPDPCKGNRQTQA